MFVLQISAIHESATSPNSKCILQGLTTGKNEKGGFLCPCHKIYRLEAVRLSLSNYTFEMTIFVSMWNWGQFVKKWYFFNKSLI